MTYFKIFLKVKWLEDLFECQINSLKVSVINNAHMDKTVTFSINHPKYGGEYIYRWISSPSRGQAFVSRNGIGTNEATEMELGRQAAIYAIQNIVQKEPIETF